MQGKAEVEETAWEAMQRRRKEKRREKKAAKLAAKNGEGEDEEEEEEEEADDFFMETTGKGGKKGGKRKREGEAAAEEEEEEGRRKRDAELELLFAGEDQEENARDFDMKELQRQERLKGKKLKGKRRRKEEAREPAPGQEFVVDTQDSRFTKVRALLYCVCAHHVLGVYTTAASRARLYCALFGCLTCCDDVACGSCSRATRTSGWTRRARSSRPQRA